MVAPKIRYHAAMTSRRLSRHHQSPIWKESLWPVRLADSAHVACLLRTGRSPGTAAPWSGARFMEQTSTCRNVHVAGARWLSAVHVRDRFECGGPDGSLETPYVRLTGRIGRPGSACALSVTSLGGVLPGKRACRGRESVSQLIYLGSPVQAVHAHPGVVTAAAVMQAAREIVSGKQEGLPDEDCRCGFSHDVLLPLPRHLRHAAIYTRADGVVDWHDSQERKHAAEPRRWAGRTSGWCSIAGRTGL